MRARPFVLSALIAAFPAAAQQTDDNVAFKDCGSAPPMAAICRITAAPDMTELLNRLSTKDTAWWRAGDTFTIVARRSTDQVRVCCVFHEDMRRIPGTDFWFLSARSPLLDSAMIDITVRTANASSARRQDWRGPQAPAAPKRAHYVVERFPTVELDSPNLGEKRKLQIYLPPGHDPAKRYPVVYVGDGQNVQTYGVLLEAQILAKKLPPIILVGLYSNADKITVDGKTMQRRTADYVRNKTPEDSYFVKHESFLLKEVMPLVESRFGASTAPEQRLLIGQSAGADWAIDTALRHPETFARAAGLSPSVPHLGPFGTAQPKLFLTNGQLLDFRVAAKVAADAKAAGEDVVYETHASGHSMVMWEVQFLDALAWAWGTK